MQAFVDETADLGIGTRGKVASDCGLGAREVTRVKKSGKKWCPPCACPWERTKGSSEPEHLARILTAACHSPVLCITLPLGS